MRRAATITICCLALSGCAAPLGMAAAGLAGGAAQEAGARVGRDAAARLGLWPGGDQNPARCEDDPQAEGCAPEALLAAYLERTSPERRAHMLAALPPDLRLDMEARLYAGVVPAHGADAPRAADDGDAPAAAPASGAWAAQAGDEEAVQPAAVGHVAGQGTDHAVGGWSGW